MKSNEAIAYLDTYIGDPRLGLPEDVFHFVSRIVPMVNVDLLVKDEQGRTLLAWRDDPYAGSGWHIPGGIVRYKETMEARILKVAQSELGSDVEFDPTPLTINQVICSHTVRGHFISVLFRCRLPHDYIPKNCGRSETDVGYLKWHQVCPPNLVRVHEMYRSFI